MSACSVCATTRLKASQQCNYFQSQLNRIPVLRLSKVRNKNVSSRHCGCSICCRSRRFSWATGASRLLTIAGFYCVGAIKLTCAFLKIHEVIKSSKKPGAGSGRGRAAPSGTFQWRLPRDSDGLSTKSTKEMNGNRDMEMNNLRRGASTTGIVAGSSEVRRRPAAVNSQREDIAREVSTYFLLQNDHLSNIL